LTAAQEGAKASQEFGVGERLDKVIVGAGIKSGDAILDRVASRQNKHRLTNTVGAQVRQNQQPIAFGKREVEDNRVKWLSRREAVAVFTRARSDRLIAVAIKHLLKVAP